MRCLGGRGRSAYLDEQSIDFIPGMAWEELLPCRLQRYPRDPEGIDTSRRILAS